MNGALDAARNDVVRQKGEAMEDPWEHAGMRWFLAIIVFIAAFHATWTALEYINRAPKPTPSLKYGAEKVELPPQESPGVHI